jgi:hypothetical protein
MPLAPSASVGIGLATGGLAFTIYNMSLPPVTDIRAAEPENGDVSATERASTWIAAGIVAGVAAITQDATVFIIGGTVVVAMAWIYRHANEVSPLTGFASGISVPGAITEQEPPSDVIYMEPEIAS